jgi:CDP-glucose 4,6-dehydratase
VIYNNFYQNKKVVITGHTGFKGSWLALTLHELGAKVCGIALSPKTNNDFYVVNDVSSLCDSHIVDINNLEEVKRIIIEFQPDIVFHLAAQPLVRYSYANPLDTYQTNVIGTANVLEAIKQVSGKCAVVLITTDKVYENKEWHYPYRETDRLGGKDPYSSSKACAEILITSYRHSFFNLHDYDRHQKSLATARAGNVIGGGDWSVDRLVPDIVRSINEHKDIQIRNPFAIRPWQHVLEPVVGYLKLALKLYQTPNEFSGEWNFGPYPEEVLKVEEVVKTAIEILGNGSYKVTNEENAPHEATLLKLDISKTVNELRWKPQLNTKEAISLTMEWYKTLATNKNEIAKHSKQSICNFLKALN